MIKVKMHPHISIGGRGVKLYSFLLEHASKPKFTYICSMEHLISANIKYLTCEEEVREAMAGLRRIGMMVMRESKGVLFMRLLVGRTTGDDPGPADDLEHALLEHARK